MTTDERIIRSHITGKTKEFLAAHPEWRGNDKEEELVNDCLRRRNGGEPLAYILGFKEFYGHNFKVSPDVLIPRPETEGLVDIAISLNPKKILDVGTGSGCIAISLALELPNRVIIGVDISDKALEVAKNNASALRAKVDLYKSNLLNGIKNKDRNCDLIVANLPYVDEKWNWIDKNLKYEPKEALFAVDNGLGVIKRLVIEARDYFTRSKITGNKHLLLEVDPCQRNEIVKFAKNYDFCEERSDCNDRYAILLSYFVND